MNDKCPKCGSDEIEGRSVCVEHENAATQGLSCMACGAEWLDIYRLAGRVIDGKFEEVGTDDVTN